MKWVRDFLISFFAALFTAVCIVIFYCLCVKYL